MSDLFSVPVFFIGFREALEAGIIVSVLLAVVDKTVVEFDDCSIRKALVRKIWLGTLAGVLGCIAMGMVVIVGFRGIADETFGGAEDIWEGVFSLIACLVISIMGASLLRIGKLQDTWHLKLSRAIEAGSDTTAPAAIGTLGNKYALSFLPFITIMREGFEAVLFIAGAVIGSPVSSIPLSMFAGAIVGILVSWLIYRGSHAASIQYFLLLSTGFLYLIAAGLFSKGVWHLEAHQWNNIVGGDAAELGSGPGSYDIRRSVWHVNCCNPDLDGGGFWGIFNAILGWQNSATVGSVVSYNVYWIAVALGMFALVRKDKAHMRRAAERPSVANSEDAPTRAE